MFRGDSHEFTTIEKRNNRKNSKKKLQEIDHQNPDAWDDYQEENIVRGYD